LDDVDDVGAQQTAALVNASEDAGTCEVFRDLTVWAARGPTGAALGGQDELVSPGRQETADAFLAPVVEWGGVDEVDACIEGLMEQPVPDAVVSIHVAELGGTETEARDLQACLAESAAFH